MPSSIAYRCLVDSERYAVVHATDLLKAGERFRKDFPDRPLVAHRIPWEDDREPAGTLAVRQRLYPLISLLGKGDRS